MDLLYITKTSPLSGGGGGEKRAREVTAGLAERGHKITILSGKTDPELEKWTVVDGCKVRHVKCIPSFLFSLPTVSFYMTRYLFAFTSIPVLIWMLIRYEYDAVIENMTPYPTPCVIFVKLARLPIFAVQHEFYDWSCYKTYDPVSATIQLLVQNLLRIFSYTCIIVPTSHTAKQLEGYGVPRSNISVITNGVNVRKYQLPNSNHQPKKLVTVGRLSKRKGQRFLLNSFESVLSDNPDSHLHIVGKGPAKEDLIKLAQELGINDSVTFHGFVSHEKKVELLNTSDIFIFASRQEGFGLVLLEAMAAGLPVVATQLPVYDEFFESGQNGYLIDQRDTFVFSNRIKMLIQNREILGAIRVENQKTAGSFSWEKTVEETQEALFKHTSDNHSNQSN